MALKDTKADLPPAEKPLVGARRGLPKGKYGGGTYWHSKLGVERWAALEADLLACEGTLQSLGVKYGVSRERVRQIAKTLGVTYYTQGEWNARVREEKIKRAAEKKAERQKHAGTKGRSRAAYAEEKATLIRNLLRTGASTAWVAEKLRFPSPNALNAAICRLRRLFPDLLPRRRPGPPHRTAKPEVLTRDFARAKRIAQLRSSGVSSAEIAVKLGYSSAGYLRWEISRLRRLFPELLPTGSAGTPYRALDVM